jgi:hypothetical protein
MNGKPGVLVSGSGVCLIWLRNENCKKWLQILEAKVASAGIMFSNAQVASLEKKKLDDEACGEIETHHPGYLVSQDTFYMGNLKGISRINHQTLVDNYGKVVFAKTLYDLDTDHCR